MKFKKVLLSSSLAITSVLAGLTIANNTVKADTTDSDTTNVQSAQVTKGQPATETVADNVDATAQADSENTETQATSENAATTDPAQASGVQAASTTDSSDSTKDAVVSKIKDVAKNAGADIVGNDIVAPVTGSVLSKVKPLSNVYAGATGFVDPSSNAVGKVSHDIQNAAIDIVGNLPGGKIPSTIMKVAQPLDLVDNGLGGLYGLATGENDLIPNAVGNKVADAIKGSGKDTTVAAAKTDYSDGYQNKRVSGTVTVNNQTAPLFNVMEQPVSRSLQQGSSWLTDILRVNTKSGQTYYRVSTNEYVRAQDVAFN